MLDEVLRLNLGFGAIAIQIQGVLLDTVSTSLNPQPVVGFFIQPPREVDLVTLYLQL